MVIVTLNDKGMVSGYEVATLTTYRQNHSGDPMKRFIDRTQFLNDTDIAHFMNYPHKYGVVRGAFQRIKL